MTLVELLAVIAIIAILGGLTFGGLSLVRERTHTAKSASQVRQILAASFLYAVDNNGHLPKVAAGDVGLDASADFYFVTSDGVATFENTAMANYLGGPEVAADVMLAPADDGIKESGAEGRNFSYSFNFLINKGELQEGASGPTGFEKALGTVRLSYIENPESKALVYEEDKPNDAFCVWFIDRPTARYKGNAHVGFADGHVELLPADEIFGNASIGELVVRSYQY